MTDEEGNETPDLAQLAADLRRLEAEYNMFFAGQLARPPWETRRRIEAVFRRWGRRRIESSVERFRFQTLQSRFATLSELWERKLRLREETGSGSARTE